MEKLQVDAFCEKEKESISKEDAELAHKARMITIQINKLVKKIEEFDTDLKVKIINEVRENIHQQSPFSSEPVDFVRWVKNDSVYANDYNPNSVAPPEMELLRHSISQDGYTQPIVSWNTDEGNQVIDGFHRHRVGRECDEIQGRIHGYLPIVRINAEQSEKNDRMASTIRHNRARGKHRVEAMSDIVVELKRRNWSPKKIAKELGMDADEVLRLAQITGLAEMFADKEFSEAWKVDLSHDNDGDNDATT